MTHPERLGKYRVTGVLGEGAMGVVYKGFDPGIQRVVALKTVRRQLLENTELGASMAQRFRNEAQAAGRLGHPGIVAVYDYGEETTDQADVAYIAMEFVEGNTLERYIANKVHFGDSDIVSVLVQLLDALEHAHTQGVWHRDIKPANVLMTRDGRLKIADFGIARIESAALTQVNSVIGTPSHMAPEQFLGAEIDRRVDIYASGVLFYQLLVGKPPFVGSAESLMYRVVHEEPVLPSAVPGYRGPGQYDRVLATALAKNPARRYATASAFKDALLAVVGKPVPATVSDATVVALPPRSAGGSVPGSPGVGSTGRPVSTAGVPT
ncbi:MAG: serine/threonine protein kinase, partial [Chitinophagaceae bacterium]|nr:serine/threonine protein kinase [Rubrivivax sp.]